MFNRTSIPDSTRLIDLVGKSKRRKGQRITSKSKKQKLSQINEGDEAIPSPSDARMFDSFDTISLGRNDSDNIIVEGPVAVPSQPSQNEKEDLQPGHDHETRNDEQPQHDRHETVNDAGVEVEGAAVEVPHVMEDSVQEDEQPEPLVVIMPINPEDQSRMATQEHIEPEPEPINVQILLEHENHSKIATEGPGEHTEPEKQIGEHTELQTEAEVTAANDTTQSADEIITNVLLSMNKGKQDQGSKQNPQPQDQKQEQERNQQTLQSKA
ncbi:hypothetical protein PIB30_001147 [Stylosanthes scabra]|uniref:Uncharacterized protein n=1 Tax=Stylosanthes scabra TaxID=79078 RepID=A0ABU6V0W0_9FABA|nr:hypothetical protein [Stylosanthes scabra]